MAWGFPTGQRPALLAPVNGLHFQHKEIPQLNPSACDQFFRSHVNEGLQLEGLLAEWKTLEEDDLKAYQNLILTLTRDLAEWQPYNPNAERDARIEAEGLYTDPIQQSLQPDEPQPELATPDFAL